MCSVLLKQADLDEFAEGPAVRSDAQIEHVLDPAAERASPVDRFQAVPGSQRFFLLSRVVCQDHASTAGQHPVVEQGGLHAHLRAFSVPEVLPPMSEAGVDLRHLRRARRFSHAPCGTTSRRNRATRSAISTSNGFLRAWLPPELRLGSARRRHTSSAHSHHPSGFETPLPRRVFGNCAAFSIAPRMYRT